MKKKLFEKKKNTSKKNLEVRGLLILSLSFLLALSLISFTKYQPNANWLGFLGYYIAYLLNYLFGLASFLFILYLGSIGVSYLTLKKLDNFTSKSISFFILLVSSSFLLTIYAQEYSQTT